MGVFYSSGLADSTVNNLYAFTGKITVPFVYRIHHSRLQNFMIMKVKNTEGRDLANRLRRVRLSENQLHCGYRKQRIRLPVRNPL
jgi:hypothetical protein